MCVRNACDIRLFAKQKKITTKITNSINIKERNIDSFCDVFNNVTTPKVKDEPTLVSLAFVYRIGAYGNWDDQLRGFS